MELLLNHTHLKWTQHKKTNCVIKDGKPEVKIMFMVTKMGEQPILPILVGRKTISHAVCWMIYH